MDTPTILALCRLLRAKPQGVSIGEVYRRFDALNSPWVDRALEVLTRAGAVEVRGGLLIPRPGLEELAQGLELVFAQVGEVERIKVLVGMVGMLLKGEE